MDKSTDDIRFPPHQNASEDNQSEKTLSFYSPRSQSDREYLERNSWRHFKTEEFQKLVIPRKRPEQPSTRYNQQELAHRDCFYSEIDAMKTRINTLLQDSYDGKLKAAFQDFEKIKGQFIKLLGQFKEDAADLCLKVGAICYRAHVDVEAEEWLNKALEESKRFDEKAKREHYRKLYLCLADILIKREKWEDADKYLKKGEKIIKDYFEEDESYEGIRSLSWAQALRAHFLSRDGKYKEAKRLYKSQIELKETLKNDRLEALAIDYLADFYITHGKKDKAKPVLERALETSRKFKHGYYTEARHLRNQARIAFEEEDVEECKELYREAFTILAKELPDGNGLELQYKEEYKKMFGVEFQLREEDFGEDYWPPTDSV